SKIEKSIRSVTPEELLSFSDLFGCTVEYIMCKSDIRQIEIQNKISIDRLHRIPILGTIRTALPLLLQKSYDGYLDVPGYMRAEFALKVTGDSMIGAGILDGDYVVCKEGDTAPNGQIVVAVKDLRTGFSEPTLKYYFDNGRDQYLRAANPNIPDIPMKEDHRIAGIMEGLIRKEAPGYHIYRDYLTSGGNNDWAEVIELASSAGMKTNQVKEILAAQIEIAKRINAAK
ncbi:MAG: S24 family peptidase, partial [Syntrophomonas sp.]